MLFGFEIDLADGAQDYGIIAAKDREEAQARMFLERGDEIVAVRLLADVETLITGQYRGFAYTTTEPV